MLNIYRIDVAHFKYVYVGLQQFENEKLDTNPIYGSLYIFNILYFVLLGFANSCEMNGECSS